jgi:hypothetical protein
MVYVQMKSPWIRMTDLGMGVWQEVAMDSLKYHYGRHARLFYALWTDGLRPTSTPLDTPRCTPMHWVVPFVRTW